MNVCKIQLVIQTRHVLTRKDLTCANVILVTMVMDSRAMVTTLYKNTVNFRVKYIATENDSFREYLVHSILLFRYK